MPESDNPGIDEAGRLRIARWAPSPNADGRPDGIEPDLLVIHNISLPPGRFGGPWIEQLFQNRLDPSAMHSLPASRGCACRRIS